MTNDQENKRMFWDKLWSQEVIKEPWANRDIPNELKQHLEKPLQNEFKNSVDIGCGLGEIALWVEKMGYNSYGFDISPSAIIKAQKNLPLDSKVKFIVHDITSSPLQQKFDCLIDRGCFHDIPQSLKINYVENIAASSTPTAVYFLFIKAFRGELKMTPNEESKHWIRHIQNTFGQYFTLSKVSVCDLSPRGKEKTMPGLFFTLTRTP
jgi:SAM-dependent methyltransferase